MGLSYQLRTFPPKQEVQYSLRNQTKGRHLSSKVVRKSLKVNLVLLEMTHDLRDRKQQLVRLEDKNPQFLLPDPHASIDSSVLLMRDWSKCALYVAFHANKEYLKYEQV